MRRKPNAVPDGEPAYIPFTKEMKRTYTILAPTMLPMQIKLVLQVLIRRGYTIDLLETTGPEICELGLRYVHNDTCYPAILVIGQFLDALKSGKYDPHRTALMLFQTGGGCRASNYISLLRKALKKAGYGYVPVISFSLAGVEKHPGFQLTLPILCRMMYALIYGDLLMDLVNQCRPYELHKGDAAALAARFTGELAEDMERRGISQAYLRANCRRILKAFSAIPMQRTPKVRVGVVGEIYVKYSPLANNNLEQFLVDEGAEVVVPGLMGFFEYYLYNYIMDATLYHQKLAALPLYRLAFRFFVQTQNSINRLITSCSSFEAVPGFDRSIARVQKYIGCGAKMGEGWLLPAEMLELYDSGTRNIVCAQPFGCLPNHIFGKGMMKPLKDGNPGMNVVAIDYDAGATRVNQENRLKLMLANAREAMEQAAGEKEAVRTKTVPETEDAVSAS